VKKNKNVSLFIPPLLYSLSGKSFRKDVVKGAVLDSCGTRTACTSATASCQLLPLGQSPLIQLKELNVALSHQP